MQQLPPILADWKRFFDAGDVEALVGLYCSDAFLEVSDLSVQAYGRSSIAEALERMTRDPEGVSIRWMNPVVQGRLVAAEYEVTGGLLQGRGVALLDVSAAGIVFDKRFVSSARGWKA